MPEDIKNIFVVLANPSFQFQQVTNITAEIMYQDKNLIEGNISSRQLCCQDIHLYHNKQNDQFYALL